jgi:hypothetical protein
MSVIPGKYVSCCDHSSYAPKSRKKSLPDMGAFFASVSIGLEVIALV